MIEALESRELFSVSLVKIIIPPAPGSTTVTVKPKHVAKPKTTHVVVHKLSTKPKVVTRHKTSSSGGEVHVGTVAGTFT